MTLTDPPDAGEETLAAPRERILKAARALFYRHGIRAVGVDAVAEAADTNKMTLYRHFKSKDELVAECLRDRARELEALWREVERAHQGDPKGQLLAWLEIVAEAKLDPARRGCAFANAAIELPEPDHPARRVIEEIKMRQRRALAALCRKAGELFLLGEGAQVSMQSLGPAGPATRLVEMFHRLVAAHEA
jgi:AcrR family transcriptional regulator